MSSALKYNELLLSELRAELLYLVNRFYREKNNMCFPDGNMDLLSEKEFLNLVEGFSNQCADDFYEDGLKGVRLNTNYQKINFLVHSISFGNIIEFKKCKYYHDLRKVYILSFLLEYNSNIDKKDRKNHIFDTSKYLKYCDDMKLRFKNEIQVLDNENDGGRTFSAMDIQEELHTFCWLFWKYCSINASYRNIKDVDQFDLIRILSIDLNRIVDFKRKVFSKKDKSQNTIKQLASSGGRAKAKNYKIKMQPIFDDVYKLYRDGNPEKNGEKWRSKNKCASYFIKNYYQKNSETELELDPKKLVSELTKLINK